MKIGVFFQTWSSHWASSNLDLGEISTEVDRVYLAFASPQSTYTLGQKTFSGTGMDFSSDFGVVKNAIDKLHMRNVEVIVSVGGATYPFDHYNAQAAADLCTDLNCDGIDLDWEPVGGFQEAAQLALIIQDYKNVIPTKKLFVTGWSTGAFPPNGDAYQGMNIYGLVQKGGLVDGVNIMAYDAGTQYDPKAALLAYRKIYNGPLSLGFQVGQQSWGGAVLTQEQADEWARFTIEENPNNSVFIWSYQKPADFDAQDLIVIADNINPTVTATTATVTIVETTTATATATATTSIPFPTIPTLESSSITNYIHIIFYVILLINMR